MLKLLIATFMLFGIGCKDSKVTVPDNRNLIDANTALIELNSEMDALLEQRVSSLENRMDEVEALIEDVEAELELLGEETEENAEDIAHLRRKLRRHQREQAHINRVNSIRFHKINAAIRSIQRKLSQLSRADALLAKKLRAAGMELSELRKALAKNTQLDLARLQKIMSMFIRVSKAIQGLEAEQISVVENCDGLLLKTPDGLVGLSADGYLQEVLYEQGDLIPGHNNCHHFLGIPFNCLPMPARLSEGETVEIFVVTSVSLVPVQEGDVQCER